MATVDDIARRALGAIGAVDMDGLVQAHGWVNDRYAELVGQVRFRHLRRAGAATIAAPLATGTLAVDRGSRIVTGTATTWTADLRGRFLRVVQTQYEIADVISATELRLSTAFGEPDFAGEGKFIQRYIVLPPEVRFTSSWTLARLWTPIEEVSLRALDEEIAPGRFFAVTLPAGGGWVAHVGYDDVRGGQVYEVYPYSSLDETLHFVYWTAPPRLSRDATIPPSIDDRILKEGVLIDVYRYAKGKALAAGLTNVAGFWRNDEYAQRTVWRDVMASAVKADRGLDDTEWLFQTIGAPWRGRRDVRSARDQIYVVGNRP